MRKLFINFLLFICFNTLFYTAFINIWGKYSPAQFKPNISYQRGAYGHLFTRLSDVKKIKNIDILFLGSSHSYRGFDPRIFSKYGLKTFNLGSSAQTPLQTEVLIDRYLSKLNPKLVIFEVYPDSFTGDGVESALDLISNDENDFKTLKMSVKINNVKIYNTLLYGFTRDLFNLNSSSFEKKIKKNDTYIYGGYVEREISFFKPIPFEKNKMKLNTLQLKSFDRIINYFKSKNINLILVYAPVTKAKYDSYINTKEYESFMNSYGEFYNFNKMLKLKDSIDFYDSHHLNQIGVKKFNLRLIDILRKKKYLEIKD